MRAFVGVDVTDAAVLAAIGRAQRRLRDEAGARPAGPAPIHFTLRFLGDVPGGEAGGGRVAAALASVRFEEFSVVIVGVGAFPSERRPGAVWVGTDADGGRRLAGLAASVAAALGPLGAAAAGAEGKSGGKPFRPHATIARMGGARKGGAAAAAAAAAVRSLRSERFGTQRIGSFKLKKSVLSPDGAVHTDVLEVAAA